MSSGIFKKEDEEIAKFKELRKREEEAFAIKLAQKLNIPYINLLVQNVNLDALPTIDEETARDAEIVVINKKDNVINVGVKNPNNEKSIDVIKSLESRGFSINIFLISNQSLNYSLNLYKTITKKGDDVSGELEITPENLWKIKEQIKNINDFKEIFQGAENKGTSVVMELIIAGSLSLDSSDIHIEPSEDSSRIRFRIDGILQEVAQTKKITYEHILNRVKLLSELKINVRNTPQDGRFSISTEKKSIEIRTSILPGPNGESIVLRILNPDKLSVSIKDLGLSDYDLELLKNELKAPNGLILTTGPTGSGKTTTLYSFLKSINKPDIKIITIEDPIEYHIDGISQSQTNNANNYTFASGLASILRQDPDVILVGEIRDVETADISIHASLTGHLVFSTLHTNDAPSTILRLIDMGINTHVLAPAINVIIAQRLVRKICKKCSKERKLTDNEIIMIKESLSDIPKEKSIPNIDKESTILDAVGCIECNNTGYKGRVGLFEIFKLNTEAEELIMSKPTHKNLIDLAKKNGMIQIKQDGFLKVLDKITTINEVMRVTE